ncbi:hypothetical protein [Nocardia miyunensis]|uniref:hypothetical protein n=1 Tax=Nocardia miyunensis TaxID=282684 RepID=UPI000836E791|nr:hypothetical protein [Nocardia miyunensis]
MRLRRRCTGHLARGHRDSPGIGHVRTLRRDFVGLRSQRADGSDLPYSAVHGDARTGDHAAARGPAGAADPASRAIDDDRDVPDNHRADNDNDTFPDNDFQDIDSGSDELGHPLVNMPEQGSPLRSALTMTGVAVSQAAVLVPILYYFGSVYTRAYYGYFGVDSDMLGLSTPGIMRRAIFPSFWPIVVAFTALTVALTLRRLPVAIARATRHAHLALRIWFGMIVAVGVVMLAVPLIVAGNIVPWSIMSKVVPTGTNVLPAMLMIGSALLCYATILRTASTLETSSAAPNPDRPTAEPSPGQSFSATASVILVALFVIGFVGAMWWVGNYAARQGTSAARALAGAGFDTRPRLLLLSVDRLGIDGSGVQTNQLTVPGEKYRHYYSGIRLLDRSADAYFVIPDRWQPGRDRVFIIPRNDDIRIDVLTTHPVTQ